jgi:hypothetical protein
MPLLPTLGALRDIPTWCNWWGVGGVADLLGVAACAPYTTTEIEADFQAGLSYACRNATDPAVCEADNRLLYDRQFTAAAQTTPEAAAGACEYEASQSHPDLSRLLGAGAVCKMFSGSYTPYLVGAAALVALLLVTRKRGTRR